MTQPDPAAAPLPDRGTPATPEPHAASAWPTATPATDSASPPDFRSTPDFASTPDWGSAPGPPPPPAFAPAPVPGGPAPTAELPGFLATDTLTTELPPAKRRVGRGRIIAAAGVTMALLIGAGAYAAGMLGGD